MARLTLTVSLTIIMAATSVAATSVAATAGTSSADPSQDQNRPREAVRARPDVPKPLTSSFGSRCSGRSKELRPRMLSSSEPLPFGTAPCPGVRPGALLTTEDGSNCSFNFLFKGSDRHRYIGTAGHCAVDSGEEMVWRRGKGVKVMDAEGQHVGEFAYATQQNPKDFALIRINKGVKASAAMCYFGGPTGINDDITDETVTLHQFGNGTGIGYEYVTGTQTLPARTGFAVGMPDPDEVFMNGAAAPGDSGSGVISSDGRAVGLLVTGGVHISDTHSGDVGITRIKPQLERAMKALGIKLKLRKTVLAE